MTTMSTPHASVDHDGAGMIVRAEPLFTVGERTAKVRVPRKHRRRARSVDLCELAVGGASAR